jgi:hypothetical protein
MGFSMMYVQANKASSMWMLLVQGTVLSTRPARKYPLPEECFLMLPSF